MKKVFTKLTALLLALTVLFTAVPVMAAEENLYVDKEITVMAYPSKDLGFRNQPKNQTFLCSVSKTAGNFKSSNSAVATLKQTASANPNFSGKLIYIVAKKAGTTTVSFKYNGKTYKTKVTVTKYINPVSSVTIGSTAYKASAFKSRSTLNLSYAKYANKKLKTTVKLAKGWKLQEYFINGKLQPAIEYVQSGWMRSEGVKNGSTIPVKGGKGFMISFTAVNSKTNQSVTIDLLFK